MGQGYYRVRIDPEGGMFPVEIFDCETLTIRASYTWDDHEKAHKICDQMNKPGYKTFRITYQWTGKRYFQSNINPDFALHQVVFFGTRDYNPDLYTVEQSCFVSGDWNDTSTWVFEYVPVEFDKDFFRRAK